MASANPSPAMRSCLVTGAGSGIGRACVATLVRLGWRVWATVRTGADEASLLAEHPERVSVLRMDLTEPESIRVAGERVLAGGPLHGLVNNAGIAAPGPLEYLPVEVFRQQLEVNVTGQLAVTQAMLPALRLARAAGEPARIVMIGSISGRVAGPLLGGYHASKFGLVGLTDTLRAELAPSGIRVSLIEPGGIATPIWERATAASEALLGQLPEEGRRHYAHQIAAVRANVARTAANAAPAERVADAVAHALTARSPRPRHLIGGQARLIALVALLPDRLRYAITAARS